MSPGIEPEDVHWSHIIIHHDTDLGSCSKGIGLVALGHIDAFETKCKSILIPFSDLYPCS
jgi:hypothetical protein